MPDAKIEKSVDQVQLEKMADQVAALEKALEDAKVESLEKAQKLEALEKAEEARKVAGAQKLVKSFGFIQEENQEAVVEFMVKSAEAPLVAEVLKQAQKAVADAKVEMEELKKSFGEEEHGVDGEPEGKVDQTIQARVDKSLDSFAETLKQMADH